MQKKDDVSVPNGSSSGLAHLKTVWLALISGWREPDVRELSEQWAPNKFCTFYTFLFFLFLKFYLLPNELVFETVFVFKHLFCFNPVNIALYELNKVCTVHY